MPFPVPRLVLSLLVAALAAPMTGDAAEKSEAREAWEAQVGERHRDHPAFAYVKDDPDLPRVLLIGDSISIGYTPYVREELAGKANVHRIPMNGGDTNRGLARIDAWLGEGDWDVIHFNWGLHDLKRQRDGKMDVNADRAVAPDAYRANLQQLVERLQETGAKLIWCATTPVPEGASGRIPGDAAAYNAIAAEIMAERNVPINDLYAHIMPHLATAQREANVHFHPDGSERLGEAVSAAINRALQPGEGS